MRTGSDKMACLGSIGPFCRHTDVMKADVVVIGAGALGLSTALHCAIAGRSVVVVERDTAGSHASGRAAGLFKSVQTDELRTGLARRSIAKALRFGDWAGVELAGGSVTTEVVVDAAGAWTRQVAGLAGATVAVAPVRHQLLITEPAQISPADPIVRVVDAAVYLRPARGGLMLGGFERGPLPFDCWGPPPDVPLDLTVLRQLAGLVGRQGPAGSAAGAEHRGGMFPMSPDRRFVLWPGRGVAGL